MSVPLNNLVKWAEKCKCLHIGQANAKMNYLMNNTVLLSTEREKDVGGHCMFRHESVRTM